jgi:hypothetical protein
MADDVQLPATGTGTADVIVATDQIGTRHFQKLKLVAGADGAAVDVEPTSSGALPVRSLGAGTNVGAQVTVTNSSTTIITSDTDRRGVLLVNQQTVAVYIDPSGGTATTSMFRLDPGASIFLPCTTAITGITSAAYSAVGDAKVHYTSFG